jgi:hypothetical protein
MNYCVVVMCIVIFERKTRSLVFDVIDNFDPDSKEIEESDLHRAKHPSPGTSTDPGIMISINPVSRNACASIRDNLDPDSTIIDERNVHKAKQSSPKTSTDAGITISINPVSWKAQFPIRDNLDPDSNVSEVNEPHSFLAKCCLVLFYNLIFANEFRLFKHFHFHFHFRFQRFC